MAVNEVWPYEQSLMAGNRVWPYEQAHNPISTVELTWNLSKIGQVVSEDK